MEVTFRHSRWKASIMLVYKAARHAILAQGRRAMLILERSGCTISASEIAQTADCLEFVPENGNGVYLGSSDSVSDTGSFRLRLVDGGVVKLEKQIYAALFSFYDRKAERLVSFLQNMMNFCGSLQTMTMLVPGLWTEF